MRALPGERTKILSKKQRIFGLVVQSSPAATKKNLTAETQRTRRFRPWERTLPACPGCPTPCTQDACAPRSHAEENPWQLATDFRLSSTENSIRVNSWNSWRLKPPRISRKRPRPFGCHWSETQFLAVSPAARLDTP